MDRSKFISCLADHNLCMSMEALPFLTKTKPFAISQMDSTNQDEDDAVIGVEATLVLAIRVAITVAYEYQSSIPREPYINKDQERDSTRIVF
ncbi:hypothetical protein P3L10_022795 [Capsicum annuum]